MENKQTLGLRSGSDTKKESLLGSGRVRTNICSPICTLLHYDRHPPSSQVLVLSQWKFQYSYLKKLLLMQWHAVNATPVGLKHSLDSGTFMICVYAWSGAVLNLFAEYGQIQVRTFWWMPYFCLKQLYEAQICALFSSPSFVSSVAPFLCSLPFSPSEFCVSLSSPFILCPSISSQVSYRSCDV